jgi:short-subunit dehydrogenase
MMLAKKTILITGASSGLGAAIAKQYATQDTRLFLFGRSEERLKLLADFCISCGAETEIICADVTDKIQMQQHISKIANHFGIDIIYTSAGVSAGTLDGPETIGQIEKIFATNLNGTINTITPAIPYMIKRNSGRIVIISSMAGLLALSSAPSYSASKAAVKVFGESLQGYLKRYEVGVSIVIPGYIDTPMTEVNNFPMPFKMSASKAATKIIKQVEQGKGIIAFPIIMYIVLKLANLLPNRLLCYINSKIPGKPAFEDELI